MRAPNRSPLGNHIDLLTGYPFKSELYTESEASIALLRGDNVIQGKIRWDDAKRWPVDLSEGLEKYYLQEGDFVIAMDRTWVKSGLKAAIVNRNDLPCILVQRVARLRPKHSLDPYFLSLLIRSHHFEQYVKGVQTETAVPHISPQQIKDFIVSLPPLPEQTAIANLLSTWDLAIEKAERLIAAKEKRFTSFTQELLHNCTEGLRHFHLRDICAPVTRKNDGNELNVLTTSAQHGLISQLDYYKKSVSAEDVRGYYLLKKGEFAYNRSSSNGYPYGAIKRLEDYPQGVLSTLYLCFSIKTDAPCDSDFMAHAFEAGLLNKQLVGVCQEGARSHGLLNITKTDFFGLKISLPAVSEQRRIAAILTTARQEIDLLKKQAEAYRRQKRGLMQKLLTGEWRVKVAEEATA